MKELKREEYINLSKESERQQRVITNPRKHTWQEKVEAFQALLKFTDLVDRGVSMHMIDNEDLKILEKVFAGLYHYKSCGEDS